MAGNIEIKAHVSDLEGLADKVEELCGEPGSILFQRDTFYKLNRHRLKLRNVNGNSELIIYDREDASGPKHSRYLRLPIPFPKAVHTVLRAILGVRGVVKKKRTLFLSGKTRIHLDEVDTLGTFLEFEVVLDAGENPHEGVGTANALMKRLGVKKENLISGSYIDLMESACARQPARR